MFCKQCGTELENDATFCSKCGAKMEAAATEEPAEAAPEVNTMYEADTEGASFSVDDTAKHIPDEGIKETFFKLHGRLNRKRFIKRYIIMVILGTILCVPILCHYMDISHGIATMDIEGNIIMLIIGLLLMIPYYCLAARRLEDMDKDSTMAKAMVGLNILAQICSFAEIPVGGICSFAALIIILLLVAKKGTVGANKYGPDPLQ